MLRIPTRFPLFPYTTLFRSVVPYSVTGATATVVVTVAGTKSNSVDVPLAATAPGVYSWTANGLGEGIVAHALTAAKVEQTRSEEHTSELQSLTNLVCRLLLE